MCQLKYSNPSILQPLQTDALCVCVSFSNHTGSMQREKGCGGEGGGKGREGGGVGAFPQEPVGQRTASWHPQSCINLDLIQSLQTLNMPGRESCPSQYGCTFRSGCDYSDLLQRALSALTENRVRIARLIAKFTSPLLCAGANGSFSCDG